MSYKKLHLYRQNIEEAIRGFVSETSEVKKVVESAQRIKYTITFPDAKVNPAMLVVDYNNDGTTTIENCRGKNQEYSAKLAAYVVQATQVSLYETGSLYFRSITDDQFDVFLDYMDGCNASMTSTSVENGKKICNLW